MKKKQSTSLIKMENTEERTYNSSTNWSAKISYLYALIDMDVFVNFIESLGLKFFRL